MFKNDKIIVDHYYCINSAQMKRNNAAIYYTALSHFYMLKSFHSDARSGWSSVTHYKMLCMAPGNEHR